MQTSYALLPLDGDIEKNGDFRESNVPPVASENPVYAGGC